MTQNRRSLLLSFAAISMIAAAAVSTIAVPAAMRASPPSPPIIATVDLETVVSNLNERADAEASMKAYTSGLQADLDKIVEELRNQENKLNLLQSGTQEKEDAAATLIQMRANAEVKKKVYDALIDQRRGKMLKKLYEKITGAAKRLAAQNRYTMVVVSDENVRVPEAPSADIERTISLKRFLHVDPAHDITAELVTMMNNEFKAGVGASAPVVPGAPAAPK
ncbi:MAG: OmpH family outer membrane protein [Phycisphaerales bacterium]